jgi:hypothetical protein
MKTPKHNARRILLIDKFITLDKAFGEYPDVFLATVAVLDDETNTPRNWSRPYQEDRIAGDCGAFTVRAFRTSFGDGFKILSSINARAVKSDNPTEYEECAKALKGYAQRQSDLYDKVGGTSDSVDGLIRQILCLGVSEVYERADGDTESWLQKGDWKRSTTGDLANRLRRAFAAEIAA